MTNNSQMATLKAAWDLMESAYEYKCNCGTPEEACKHCSIGVKAQRMFDKAINEIESNPSAPMENPVSGGVDFNSENHITELRNDWEKQPTPADEALSKNIKNINADLEQWDNVIAPNYKSPNSDVDIGELYYYASKFREALSQPPKPAMSKEELINKLSGYYAQKDRETYPLATTMPSKEHYNLKALETITALEAAGVLNVKGA